MAALTLPGGRAWARSAVVWLLPSTLFGRLAVLLIVAVLASHVLALSLMWELRPAPPHQGGPGSEGPPRAWADRSAPVAPGAVPSPAAQMPPAAEQSGRGGPGPRPGPPSLRQVLDAPLSLQLGLLLDICVRLAVLIAAAWWAARWLAQPIHRLASAAQELGRNLDRPPLPEDGPTECRDASRVFNQMQERLRQQLADRDGFVAAVSHDLRTPLTRLRLRAESLADPQDQQRFGRDIAEMDAMITATLDYLRGVAHAEPLALVDVGALVHSLADDHQDMGHDVTVQGHTAPLPVQAGALRRCLDNLVGNAVRYGGAAELALHDGPEHLRITVRDHGPGLPEAELARVMAPFYRVEASRNRDSGGVGLGLTIAQDIARRHGGLLRLSNAPAGGLLAEVLLPRSPGAGPGG
ncbi:ATP-binding protein [Acidovorax sp. 106]|uniref:ATP-binding protein n=1 Tax=Acidovorax sp. 106 TaxID=2135637 RepID=UPI000EAF8F5B|nr:ATP-binding protein [Acidovorax sp. 106]RLJ39174.1 protein-histidine pros-kinase [Acidovorax sp. 106]